MLTDVEIASLESLAEQFGGVFELGRVYRQYQIELSRFLSDAWKISVAQLERTNPGAYSKVLKSFPDAKSLEIAEIVKQYQGKLLPEIQMSIKLSEAKVIAAAKGGGTIVKP